MPEAHKINVNDEVLLRVTESGWRTYDEYWKPYLPPGMLRHRPPVDAEGRTRLQLHEVMLVFGHRMHMGNMDLPFGTEMELVR